MKCLTELESKDWQWRVYIHPLPSQIEHYHRACALSLCSCKWVMPEKFALQAHSWASEKEGTVSKDAEHVMGVKCCVKWVNIYLGKYLRAMSGIRSEAIKIQSGSKKYVIEGSHLCLFDSVVNWVKNLTSQQILMSLKLFFSLDELEQNL